MPSKPETTVSMYQEAQADAYSDALDTLREQGELSGDESAGEELATLSRAYLDASNPQTRSNTGTGLRDFASLALGFVGLVFMVLVVVAVFGGAVYLAWNSGILPV